MRARDVVVSAVLLVACHRRPAHEPSPVTSSAAAIAPTSNADPASQEIVIELPAPMREKDSALLFVDTQQPKDEEPFGVTIVQAGQRRTLAPGETATLSVAASPRELQRLTMSRKHMLVRFRPGAKYTLRLDCCRGWVIAGPGHDFESTSRVRLRGPLHAHVELWPNAGDDPSFENNGEVTVLLDGELPEGAHTRWFTVADAKVGGPRYIAIGDDKVTLAPEANSRWTLWREPDGSFAGVVE